MAESSSSSIIRQPQSSKASGDYLLISQFSHVKLEIKSPVDVKPFPRSRPSYKFYKHMRIFRVPAFPREKFKAKLRKASREMQ